MKRLLVVALVGMAGMACAWNEYGHGIAAKIAYDNLTPKARKAVDALVRVGVPAEEQSLFSAAVWADKHRNPESGKWHYINLHFRTDGKPVAGKPDEENVVTAIERFREELGDTDSTQADRAKAFRYLIHFIGDVHQPLHAVARESVEHPTGDRGGNDFAVQPLPGFSKPPKNLHSLWDAGCGWLVFQGDPKSSAARKWANTQAEALESRYPAKLFAKDLRVTAPMLWAKESLWLAKNRVYKLAEKSMPTPAYLKLGQDGSRKRIALAGYRLARVLNAILDPGSVKPISKPKTKAKTK